MDARSATYALHPERSGSGVRIELFGALSVKGLDAAIGAALDSPESGGPAYAILDLRAVTSIGLTTWEVLRIGQSGQRSWGGTGPVALAVVGDADAVAFAGQLAEALHQNVESRFTVRGFVGLGTARLWCREVSSPVPRGRE